MTTILIVERLGEIKALTVKQFDKAELYKKAGFKVADGFDEQACWQVDHRSGPYTISVYAKSKGRAGQENKYDFPPPIDSTLLFGNAVIVRWSTPDKTTPMSLTTEQWDIVYEELFGGFEDLDDTAEADEADLLREPTPELDENGALIPLSKHGYLMDGFVVDDTDSLDDDGFDTEEEEIVAKPTKKRVSKPKKSADAGGDTPAPKKTKAKKTDESTPTPTPKKNSKKDAEPKETKKDVVSKAKKAAEPPQPEQPVEPQPIIETTELEEEDYFK